MYRKMFLVLLALMVAGVATACGGQQGSSTGGTTEGEAAGYPVTVEDDAGRTVKIESEPQEIGSMAPSVTETLFKVGAGKRVEGVTTADDYPEQVRQIQTIGDYRGVNAEKVASLGIDVLFLSFDTTAEQADDLQRKTGATTVVVDPSSVEEAIESIGFVGKVVGSEQRAESVEDELEADLSQIEQKVSQGSRPTVFYEVSYDPLISAGPESFIGDAIELAGAENVVEGSQEYPQYSLEKLLQKNPQYYLIGDGGGVTAEDVSSRSRYSSLSAVEKGNVEVVDADLVSRPGPRIVEGVREIAEATHPGAFR